MNPFPYSGPVLPPDLIDREGEASALLGNALDGNNSRLVAPRRYGKTSLLHRLVRDAEHEGWATVYVDFFGVLTLNDVASRIEQAYATQLKGRMALWFAGARRLLRPTLRAGGGPIPASIEITPIDPQNERPLLERLALPRRLHEKYGARTLVVFDEFQDVLTARQRADAVLRSEIQHHGGVASYVFAGSHVGMMRELFTDKRRAFYGQAGPIALPPLSPEDVAGYVVERFERTDRSPGAALDRLIGAAQGHPQRTMLLANSLWERTPRRRSAGDQTWLAAYEAVRAALHDEHRAVWSGLTTSHRRVLATVAANTSSLYATNREFGGSRGGTVANAVSALLDRGEIVEDGATPTGYRVVDPMLADWVNAGRPDDGSVSRPT